MKNRPGQQAGAESLHYWAAVTEVMCGLAP